MSGAARPAAVALLLLVIAPPVDADTATGGFTVNAAVFSGCGLTTSELVIPLARDQVIPGVVSVHGPKARQVCT